MGTCTVKTVKTGSIWVVPAMLFKRKRANDDGGNVPRKMWSSALIQTASEAGCWLWVENISWVSPLTRALVNYLGLDTNTWSTGLSEQIKVIFEKLICFLESQNLKIVDRRQAHCKVQVFAREDTPPMKSWHFIHWYPGARVVLLVLLTVYRNLAQTVGIWYMGVHAGFAFLTQLLFVCKVLSLTTFCSASKESQRHQECVELRERPQFKDYLISWEQFVVLRGSDWVTSALNGWLTLMYILIGHKSDVTKGPDLVLLATEPARSVRCAAHVRLESVGLVGVTLRIT